MIMVLPKASATNLSPGSVAALTRLDGRLMSSGSGFLGLWLTAGWMSRVLCLLLMLTSSVLVQALLPLWPSGMLLGEQSHFLCLGLRVSAKTGAQLECWQPGYLTWGELEVECWLRMLGCSWILGQWCPQILEWFHPLGHPPLVPWWWWVLHSLIMWDQHLNWQWWTETKEEASPNRPNSSEKGPPWRWHLPAQPSWPIGPLVSEPSWTIAGSTCFWAILVCWSSWFLVSSYSLRTSPLSSLALAWVTGCNCLKARLKQSASFSLCAHVSIGVRVDDRDWQWHRLDKWCSSSELSYSASMRNG